MSRIRQITCAYAAIFAAVMATGVSSGQEHVVVSGDIRVRNENLFGSGGFTPDGETNHSRIRARVAVARKVDESWDAGLRIATGGGTTSTNQDLDALNGAAPLYLDRAFARFRAGDTNKVELAAGRMANPYVHSPIVWDSDYNPDGLAEKFTFGNAFVTLGQHVIAEETDNDFGPGFFVVQPGFVARGDWGELELAVAYYLFDKVAGTHDVPADGDYALADVYVGFTKKVGMDTPLSAWVDVVSNLEADDDGGAFGVGFAIGSTRGKGAFKASLAYMSIDANALWINLGDANFSSGLRTANMDGFVLGLGVGLGEKTSFGLSWYAKDDRDSDAHQDQLEVDLVIKF